MKDGTAFFLGAAILGGGVAAYYVTKRKEQPKPAPGGLCPPGFHLMPDGTCMPDAQMPRIPSVPPLTPVGQSVPDWVPDDLVSRYNACWTLGCSTEDYNRLLGDLVNLMQQREAVGHLEDLPLL